MERRKRCDLRDGYALLGVLLLLSVLFTLLLSLSGMLRISMFLQDQNRSQLEARQAAWNAAMQGLVLLQEKMGEDRHSSSAVFPSNIESSKEVVPGVDVRDASWRTERINQSLTENAHEGPEDFLSMAWDSKGKSLGWLGLRGRSGIWRELSPGIEAQIHQGDPVNPVMYDQFGVAVAEEDSSWFFSYWIAEEGTKSSIASWRRVEGGEEGIEKEGMLEKLSWEANLNPSYEGRAILNYRGNTSGLREPVSLLERTQLPFADRDYERGFITLNGERYFGDEEFAQREIERILFHTTTVEHLALLTHPVKGGFKKNLLASGISPFDEWLNVRSEFSSQQGFLIPVSEQVFPLLTSLKIQFILIRKETGLYLRQRLFARWWNPYTSTLWFPEGVQLALEIKGLPESVKLYGEGQLLGVFSLASLLNHAHPGDGGGFQIRFPFARPFWSPGRTWHWAGIHPQTGESYFDAPNLTDTAYQRDYPLNFEIPSVFENSKGNYQIKYDKTPEESFSVDLGVLDHGVWKSNQIIQGGVGLQFQEGRVTAESLEELIPYNPKGGDAHAGYRVRLYESGYYGKEASAQERGDWLNRDLRDRILIATTFPLGHYEYNPDPTNKENIQAEIGLEGVDFRRLDTRPIKGNNALRPLMDFTLFEHFWTAPQTLASLQHIPIEGRPPYSLGNPWGEGWNGLFDEFYLYEEHASTKRSPFYRRLYPHEETAVPDFMSKNEGSLVVQGAFNVNSVNVHAWASLLAHSLVEDWWYWERGDTGEFKNLIRTSLENPFFRFLQTASVTFDLGLKTDAKTTIKDIPPREYFLRGVREFQMKQIRRLAEALVLEIKQFHAGNPGYKSIGGRAFLSLEEFINSGVIHRAIEEAGLNQLEAWESWVYDDLSSRQEKLTRDDPHDQNFTSQQYDKALDEIWERTPFHLSQADILSKIDPLLTVRSDTWLIRGYAEKQTRHSHQIYGEPLSKAMVEIQVQRVYELTPNPTSEFQRRFRIISVRWL